MKKFIIKLKSTFTISDFAEIIKIENGFLFREKYFATLEELLKELNEGLKRYFKYL